MKIFREYSQGQGLLLPPSLDEFVPENHEARIVNEVVDTMDLSPLLAKYEGGGAPAYHPAMMLKVIIYAYSRDIFLKMELFKIKRLLKIKRRLNLMRKKGLLISSLILALVLISSVLFSCTQPTPAPVQPIELKFAHFLPPGGGPDPVWREWASKVESQTGGKVKFTFYPAEGLHKGVEFHAAVTKGITDITLGVNVYDPTRFPLSLITDVPLMGWPDPVAVSATAIFQKLYDKYPEIRNETKDVKLLTKLTFAPRNLHLANKKVANIADLKGVKIGIGGMAAKTLEILGGTPIMIMPPDYAMSLERGTIEGIATSIGVIHQFKVLDLVPYHTDADFGMNTMYLMMNLEKWNSLPTDVQKVINDLEPWLFQETMKAQEGFEQMAVDYAKGKNHTFVQLTPEQNQTWTNAAKPIHEQWVADTEAKGLPAKAVFEDTQRLIKEYK